ncbi:MAG: O-antigen ligase family protein [Chloroflexota bacterium]
MQHIEQTNPLAEWLLSLDRRLYALVIGAGIGIAAGVIGVAIAYIGPILTGAAFVGIFGAVYIITDERAALYGTLVTMMLLPFSTFPFKIILTPTLLDATLGAFVGVYALQWITGRRRTLRLTPANIMIAVYTVYFVFAFVLGLRFGAPTNNILRQFAETLLAISMTFILVDITRDEKTLRRMVLLVILLVACQSLLAIFLWVLPDAFAERQLIRLARIGYPDGGVIRYVEDNPGLAERAIGTFVDPNVLGGALAIFASMITPQIFAKKPVIPFRWLTFAVWGVVIVALLLTFSRAAMVGFAAGLVLIATLRYRKLFYLMIAGLMLLLFLPQTQFYIERFVSAFGGRDADPATLMRMGEYGDSIELIRQYPWFGVGFTGTPTADLYTSVASMYLIIANHIGLIGLALFLITMLVIFLYGWRAWQAGKDNDALNSILLGYYAALLTVLTTSIADMYYFRLDFQSQITLFWLIIALALATARLALEDPNET